MQLFHRTCVLDCVLNFLTRLAPAFSEMLRRPCPIETQVLALLKFSHETIEMLLTGCICRNLDFLAVHTSFRVFGNSSVRIAR